MLLSCLKLKATICAIFSLASSFSPLVVGLESSFKSVFVEAYFHDLCATQPQQLRVMSLEIGLVLEREQVVVLAGRKNLGWFVSSFIARSLRRRKKAQ